MPSGYKVRQYGIVCKHLDAEEFYFGANHKVYPCCYLYDEEIEINMKRNEVLPSTQRYGDDYNDLTVHTFEEIQNHEYFKKTLAESCIIDSQDQMNLGAVLQELMFSNNP